ncbi:hypothetical protein MMC30_001865 [Trapelia coarctata]|nr:hypothetical protein [Trapelia coarctata]
MPEDDSGSEISESREQPVSHRWRGRLLSKTGKLGKAVDKVIREKNALAQQETDVSDFLHGSGEKAVAKPRVDTPSTSRWPAAAVVLGTVERPTSSSSRPTTASSSGPVAAQSSNVPALPPRKRRVAKGLRVTFTTEAPAIIGEGGDEAELPSKDVVWAWAKLGSPLRQQQGQSSIDQKEVRREAALPEALIPAYDRRSQHSPPPRTTTTIQRKPLASLDILSHLGDTSVRSQQQEGHPMSGQSEVRQGRLLSQPYPEPERSPLPEPHLASPRGRDHASSLVDARSSQRSIGEVPGVYHPAIEAPYNPSKERAHALNFAEAEPSQRSTGSGPNTHLYVADNASKQVPETPITPTHGYKDVVSPYLDEFLDDSPTQDSSKGHDQSDEFYSRVDHLCGLFHLASERSPAIVGESIALWIRASIWWFLKGRNGLESSTRMAAEQHQGPPTNPQSSPQALQCYVDLAKAWWIAREIIPDQLQRQNHSEGEIIDTTDGLRLPLVKQVYASLQANMSALTISMQKNRLLPSRSLLVQGLDTRIWIDYPALSPDILALTADMDPRTAAKRTLPNEKPFFAVLLADTVRHFSYGRMFVEVEIVSEYEGLDEYQLPCILSIIREPVDSRVEVTIVSQDGHINLHIQSDKNRGPTWDDIEWKVRSHSVRIHLAQDFELAVRFWEGDFKTLWGIYDYNRRIEKDWCARGDEVAVFDDMVENFHYMPSSGLRSTFPSKPVRSCKVRLFEVSRMSSKSSGQEKMHAGYRLMVITPPDIKTLSSIGARLDPANPGLFSYLRGEGGRPALLLRIRTHDTKSTLVLTFRDMEKRAELHALLNGTLLGPDESESAKIQLKDFRVSLLTSDLALNSGDLAFVPEIKWEYVKVIETAQATHHSRAPLPTSRRICIGCNLGTISDRINSGPGELQIGLDVANPSTIKILRSEQEELTISFAENLLAKGDWQRLFDTLSTISSSPNIRTYKFLSSQNSNAFQALVTGFSVKFDGSASSLAISRRRMVVPIHKHLEANNVRLQVVRRDGSTQLLAIFQNFALGRCMNFALKGTDVFESFNRSGKFYVRLVDAKFSMPKSEKEEGWEFLCLDIVDYSSEHDDIVIGFETEAERDRFGLTLPASIAKLSKMASLRK